jgi:hypothetical protein
MDWKQVLIDVVMYLLGNGLMGAVVWWFIDTSWGLQFVDLVAKFLAWFKPGTGEAKRYAALFVAVILAAALYGAACVLGVYELPATFPEWEQAVKGVLGVWGISAFMFSQMIHARMDSKLRVR